MKIEMCESLVCSWLKHTKHCLVVNSNWKASPYWTPAVPDDEISHLFETAMQYFNEHELRILDGADVTDWHSVLLQTECDVVGVARAGVQNAGRIYAVESAYHRDKLQYSKVKASWQGLHLPAKKVTAWNIALKMFKNALSMYRWYGARCASVVFVAPMSSEPVEREIVASVTRVRQFFQEQGYEFDFELYLEHGTQGTAGTFAECVKSPVDLAATIVDDTAELYMRGLVLQREIESIDVLMLELACRSLHVASLDEMTGLYLESPITLLAGIEQIRAVIITATAEEDEAACKKQRNLFDRCHGALRAYFSALHELPHVPTIRELRRIAHAHGAEAPNPAGVVGEPVLHPIGGVQIVLNPANPEDFKQQLVQTHLAKRVCHFANQDPKTDWWRADSFAENSNLMGNIKSTSVYRKAHITGLTRIELTIANAIDDAV